MATTREKFIFALPYYEYSYTSIRKVFAEKKELLSHGLVRPAFSGPSCFVRAKYADLSLFRKN